MTVNEAEGLIRLSSTKVPDVGALKTFINKHVLKQSQGQEGFDELNKVFTALKELGVKNVEIDLSLARGMDYYTSTIFEAAIMEKSKEGGFSSVAGGGRYDKLINLFTGKDIPAVGISIGIDRLFSAMTELSLIEKQNIVDVLVLNLEKGFEEEYLKITTSLRTGGFNAEMFYNQADLKKQFAYAEAKSIPFAILFGEDEKKSGEVTIRDLKTRKQNTIKIKDLQKEVKKLLKP
jgi:histidyl-tRNA synthetase